MALSGGIKQIDQAAVSLVAKEFKDRLEQAGGAGVAVFAALRYAIRALRRCCAGANVHAFSAAMDRRWLCLLALFAGCKPQ